MNHYELIAQCSEHLPKDLLSALVKALSKPTRQVICPTEEEERRFAELWKLRKEYPARNGGDPRNKALEAFCRRMREKDAPQEHIMFGIRSEYSKPVKDLAHHCQMETFMSQRRWETYTYHPVAERNVVVPIRAALPAHHFLNTYKQGSAS